MAIPQQQRMGLLIMATVKARKPAITAGKTLEAKAINEMPNACKAPPNASAPIRIAVISDVLMPINPALTSVIES